jgi:hypothetical protein
MNDGALVLVDCLGFRGIWTRVDPRLLIDRLKTIEARAEARVVPKYSSSMLSFGPVRFHVRLLSDTVALSVQYEQATTAPDDRQLNLLVSVACEAASVLAGMFIDDDLPLPVRGCISFGRHLSDGNFLLGPAVDEAAECMNAPQGAFIWVLPTAADRHRKFVARAISLIKALPTDVLMAGLKLVAERGVNEASKLLSHAEAGTESYVEAMRVTYAQMLAAPTVIEPYSMPLKDGAHIDASVVNPLLSAQNNEGRRRMVQPYEQFLQGNRLDIWLKRQNTLKFSLGRRRSDEEIRGVVG